MYVYVEDARGLIGRVTKVVYRYAVLLYRIRSDTTPGLFTVRLRFSIFVNDTGLNSVHVYVGASSFLCSPMILSFSLFLSLSLSLSLSPSFSYSIFPSLSFSTTPFSVFAERFDQRCLRSRRIRDDQWGINARRDRQILVRV